MMSRRQLLKFRKEQPPKTWDAFWQKMKFPRAGGECLLLESPCCTGQLGVVVDSTEPVLGLVCEKCKGCFLEFKLACRDN